MCLNRTKRRYQGIRFCCNPKEEDLLLSIMEQMKVYRLYLAVSRGEMKQRLKNYETEYREAFIAGQKQLKTKKQKIRLQEKTPSTNLLSETSALHQVFFFFQPI